MNVLAQAAGAVSTGEAITFWILGPIALAGALGMVFARNAVHSAPDAGRHDVLPGRVLHRRAGAVPRLRADHRLHRRGDDAVPVRADAGRPGQLGLGGRGAARAAAGRRSRSGSGWPCCWSARSAARSPRSPRSDWTPAGPTPRGNVTGIGRLVFTKYLFAFELTSALLITAALGAMVLTYGHDPRRSQARAAGHRGGPAARRARPDLAAARPRGLRHRQLGGRARGAARRLDSPGVHLGDHRRHPDRAGRRAPGRPARLTGAARARRTGRPSEEPR